MAYNVSTQLCRHNTHAGNLVPTWCVCWVRLMRTLEKASPWAGDHILPFIKQTKYSDSDIVLAGGFQYVYVSFCLLCLSGSWSPFPTKDPCPPVSLRLGREKACPVCSFMLWGTRCVSRPSSQESLASLQVFSRYFEGYFVASVSWLLLPGPLKSGVFLRQPQMSQGKLPSVLYINRIFCTVFLTLLSQR